MKFLKITFLFICVAGFAQTKVGTIDVDFVVSKMPELAGAQQQVADYGKTLDADFDKKVTAYKGAVDDYTKNEANYTLNQKKQKQDSLIAMENDIQKYQANGNQLLVLKQEEALKPLYEKIGIALEKVAQAGGYTQVLMRNDDVVYVDNRFDLTLAVLKEMGIEVKENE
ncbi:MAG: OmpH family outer membrane protein [Bacteroidota bacterium]